MTPVIETIFSLIFIFLVFSLITSWIVEFIAARVQKRGKMLRQFIVDALDDKFNKNWGVLMYGHPLIDVLHREVKLSKGFGRLFHNNKLNIKRKLPAYIPAEQFSTALIDLVISHQETSRFTRNAQSGKYELVTAVPSGQDLSNPALVAQTAFKRSFNDFLSGLHAMKESELKITLVALTRHITATDGAALNQLHSAIANWYENGMERLNGWYKRKIRIWLFWSGLIVAVCFNVDTIKVVSRLYSDPQMRTAVASAADRFLKENQEISEASGAQDVKTLTLKVDSLRRLLDPLNLPIGWQMPPESQTQNDPPGSLNYLLNKIKTISGRIAQEGTSPGTLLGWLLTAFALSFGAPFWFDALKKITNVRSAGLRPATKAVNNDQEKR